MEILFGFLVFLFFSIRLLPLGPRLALEEMVEGTADMAGIEGTVDMEGIDSRIEEGIDMDYTYKGFD